MVLDNSNIGQTELMIFLGFKLIMGLDFKVTTAEFGEDMFHFIEGHCNCLTCTLLGDQLTTWIFVNGESAGVQRHGNMEEHANQN